MNSQDVNYHLEAWLLAFSENSSDPICALYDEQATLWGTLSPIKRNSPLLIKEYFELIFGFQNRQVILTESNIRYFNDIAICNGQYTFSWLDNKETITLHARFSFVYVKKAEKWLIVEHHSSAIPE